MVLTISNLHVRYGTIKALHGISLEVHEGEILSIIGANGAGKSTLLKTITGFLRAESGDIIYQGRSIKRERPDRLVQMGLCLVPEGRRCFPNLTVLENLLAAARGSEWTLEKVVELFPRLGERLNNGGAQLSGGEQQMLTIGRALMTNPDLLILDEATEGLAPLIREEIWRALAALRQAGQSILVIDKYVQRLIHLADRHVIIEKGRVAWSGSSEALDADRELWHRYLGV